MKTCTRCKKAKLLDEFHKEKRAIDGRTASCGECNSLRSRQYYSNNKEKVYNTNNKWKLRNKGKVNGYKKAWDKRNPQALKAKKARYKKRHPEASKEYYIKNKEKIDSKYRQWVLNNPDKKAAQWARYNASKLQAMPKWLNDNQHAEILECYSLAKELQWLSEDPLEVDHIIPLQGRDVSGLHVPWNLQYLTRSENRKKGCNLYYCNPESSEES